MLSYKVSYTVKLALLELRRFGVAGQYTPLQTIQSCMSMCIGNFLKFVPQSIIQWIQIRTTRDLFIFGDELGNRLCQPLLDSLGIVHCRRIVLKAPIPPGKYGIV